MCNNFLLFFKNLAIEHDKGSAETLSLCAETEEEKKIWVHALKRVLYASKGGGKYNGFSDLVLMLLPQKAIQLVLALILFLFFWLIFFLCLLFSANGE